VPNAPTLIWHVQWAVRSDSVARPFLTDPPEKQSYCGTKRDSISYQSNGNYSRVALIAP